ncbi:phenylalanine--tRNA ligase subunit beta [Sneathiella sp. HT1-7]|jgi:phenylalanyl-tRNA synthetase beta chain|uniref:phenylalanine--tRNA ligase subunit beta n=1 Tax=Sneathiella sp. HT1-7 TaxID=2887192 RepID=UPI001D15BE0B|nr:phenylalanine--tRNA ligase subunit beta [Sneathiella sp. HT1-7]MCC3304199.1 phenylalanine--tRNA ligase subunit beta [Sneathiella sp. HT1-7]
MKFTVSWLKEHLEYNASLEDLSDRLTAIGLEVEEITDRAKDLAVFRVAHVIEAIQHPDADRLRVCKVDTGEGVVQVVCGAPNAHTGMKGVFAPSGAYVPGTDLWLKPTKIRGVESNGMLVSEREMGISDEHDGIIEMPEDTEIGASFAALAGLDDPVVEIAITPNHQDALGVYGIARDLAASGFGTLKSLDTSAVAGAFESPIKVKLNFDNADPLPCSKFVGRYVRGVKNGPSPKWLQDKLRAIGLRPISALVDITNLVTFDLGRPLHVFDADKINGSIQARLAKDGEKLLALDGEEYKLDGDACVIADDDSTLGLGGIMGGELSGCSEVTTNVFIEAALFDPISIATTGRKLGIESDARYRFERGVDPAFVEPAMEIATRLVLELCGGEPSEVVIAGDGPDWQKSVELRKSRVKELGGIEIPVQEMVTILDKLGFAPEDSGDVIRTEVPSWRMDVEGEADLVEEVLRMHGYDNIEPVALPLENVVAKPAVTAKQRRVRIAKRALAARGMMEAVTWSFLPRAHADLFGGVPDEIVLVNPISADLDAMRPSLLPNLIAAAGRNHARGFSDISLFEVGSEYHSDQPEGQVMVAGGIRGGQTSSRHWAGSGRKFDAYDAKADALALLEAVGGPASSVQVVTGAPEWYHPGRSGVMQLGPKNRLASFGEIHPRVLEAMKVKGPIVGFEIYLDNIPLPKSTETARPPLVVSDYQFVERDFAFEVDVDVAADTIIRAARGSDKKLITDVSIFDIYQGDKITAGRKSVALSVRLQPMDRTLTEEEIDAVAAKVIGNIEKATGGSLRQ